MSKVKEGAEKAKEELEKAKKEFEDRMGDDLSDKGDDKSFLFATPSMFLQRSCQDIKEFIFCQHIC